MTRTRGANQSGDLRRSSARSLVTGPLSIAGRVMIGVAPSLIGSLSVVIHSYNLAEQSSRLLYRQTQPLTTRVSGHWSSSVNGNKYILRCSHSSGRPAPFRSGKSRPTTNVIDRLRPGSLRHSASFSAPLESEGLCCGPRRLLVSITIRAENQAMLLLHKRK